MGSKNQTSTAVSSPNATAAQYYMDILGRANTVGNSPYNPYGGELVPGVNAQQNLGIGNINTNANYAQPFVQQAAGLATSAATPITQGQIQGYESPYTQDVINSTMAQFANQNSQQLQGVKGNAIAQNALGGNREAVAEAETTNQQNLAQAPVIAGLKNTGYGQAVQLALSQQQAQAQGAYSLGNLGVSGQNAALTGANAQVGAGNLQYGVSSAQDQAAYQQFLNQQAFPYQQLGWEAGLATGVGSNLGGTTTTTQPGPSIWSQLIGAGTAAAGAAGKAGAFAKDGGRIQGLAVGGVPYGGTGMPYGSGVGYVPTMQITHGRGAPPPPGQQQQAGGVGDTSNLGYLFKNSNKPMDLGTGYTPSAVGDSTGMDVMPSAPSSGDAIYYRGGGVRGFADGGAPIMTAEGLASVPDWLSDAQYTPSPGMVPDSGDMPSGFSLNGDTLGLGASYQGNDDQDAAVHDFRTANAGRPPLPDDDNGIAAINRAVPIRGVAPSSGALSYSDEPVDRDQEVAYASRPVDMGVRPSATAGLTYEHPHTDPWGALMAAGLGMMASKSHFVGQAIGEGGLMGLKEYSGEQAQNIAEAEKKVNLAQQNKRIDLESTRLDQAAKQAQAHLNLQTAAQAETAQYHRDITSGRSIYQQGLLDRTNMSPTGMQTEDGHAIWSDKRRPGVGIDSITGEPVDPAAKVIPVKPPVSEFHQTGTQTEDGHPIVYDQRRPGVALDSITGQPVDPLAKVVPVKPPSATGARGGVTQWKYNNYLSSQGLTEESATPEQKQKAFAVATGKAALSEGEFGKVAEIAARGTISNNPTWFSKSPEQQRQAIIDETNKYVSDPAFRASFGLGPRPTGAPVAPPATTAPAAAVPAPPAPTATVAPPRPSTVPPGSAFSPSRKQWRAPDGTIYAADGTRVQ